MRNIAVEFQPADDLVVFSVQGELDLPALIKATDDHYASHPTHRTLFDLRKADGSNLSFRDMKHIYSEQRSRHVPDDAPRSALLVKDVAGLALAKLYGVMTESEGTPMLYEAFLDVHDAEAWLGVAPGTAKVQGGPGQMELP